MVRKNGSDLAQRHRVSQAQAVVSVEAHCPFHEALALMTERARADGESIEHIADAVLSNRISFR